MLTPRLHIRRTARFLNRGGFTLVELLVVIGIIAILAGVALGPITNGIKKAKQSSGVQSAHALGLAMYSYANDNSQTYPDSSGGTADNIASLLMGGGYVTEANIFYLSGDTSGSKPTSTTSTASGIVGSGVTCWDFLGNSGSGVDATKYTFLPILWSHIKTPASTFQVTAGTAITGTLDGTNPFSTDGAAFFYINNSAAFQTASNASGTATVNMVTGANNTSDGTVPTSYKTIAGK